MKDKIYSAKKQRLLKTYLDAFSKYSNIALIDINNIRTSLIVNSRLLLR